MPTNSWLPTDKYKQKLGNIHFSGHRFRQYDDVLRAYSIYRIRIWTHIESRTFSMNLKRDSM